MKLLKPILKRLFSSNANDNFKILICQKEATNFCVRCLKCVGAKQSHAQPLADVMIAADYAGHYSHGLNRLEMYVKDYKNNMCSSKNEPKIVKETPSTALVDGASTNGALVGVYCIDVAIKKAKDTGVAWIAAQNSNHFGIAGWYTQKVACKGLIGMAFTNTSPLVYATRSKIDLGIGTNPLAIAAPGATSNDMFMLDMATSAVALGKIEMARRKQMEIPLGWAADKSGQPTSDPTAAISGGLMPLGGSESTGGYKGYGLGMMVELFCGILADAEFGTGIRKWMTTDRIANLGHSFVALDPNAFAPGFTNRLSEYLKQMRSLPSVEDCLPVLVPGDPERERKSIVDSEGGIRYPKVLIESLDQLAKCLSVEPIKVLKKL